MWQELYKMWQESYKMLVVGTKCWESDKMLGAGQIWASQTKCGESNKMLGVGQNIFMVTKLNFSSGRNSGYKLSGVR